MGWSGRGCERPRFRGIVISLVAGLMLVACNQRTREVQRGPATTVATPTEGPSPVRVTYEKLSITSGAFSVVGRFLNPTGDTVSAIEFEVVVRDDEGRELARFGDTLPFCPDRSDCWWGTYFPASRKLRDAQTVNIEILDSSESTSPEGARMSMVEFAVERQTSGTIIGSVPEDEGMVFVVAFREGKAQAGIGVNVFSEEGRKGRQLHITSDLLPKLGPREELRAFIYAFPMNRGA